MAPLAALFANGGLFEVTQHVGGLAAQRASRILCCHGVHSIKPPEDRRTYFVGSLSLLWAAARLWAKPPDSPQSANQGVKP
jgi:hypothetical protein